LGPDLRKPTFRLILEVLAKAPIRQADMSISTILDRIDLWKIHLLDLGSMIMPAGLSLVACTLVYVDLAQSLRTLAMMFLGMFLTHMWPQSDSYSLISGL
jgi:hypothetical protein